MFVSFLFSLHAGAQNIDIDILKSINPRHPNSDVWRISSGSVDWLSAGIPLGVLVYGLIDKNKDEKNNGYELISAMLINASVTELLKIGFNRTRPADRYPDEIFVRSATHGSSFPSGHTSQAFAMATTLSLQCRKWYIVVPLYAWAGCVGYSRMYLGKHYPSDVLAGAMVGAASSLLSRAISNKLFRHKKFNLER